MCAVIGAVLKNPSLKDFEALKRVFLESRIRGMHATGMSFLPSWSKEIVTIKEAKPADYFVETHLHNDNFKDYINEDGNLYLIGHCRYSTSDLEFNQPIANSNTSVVHNGVITQELPEKWKELYGYDCVTQNDTELLLHTIEDGLSPLEHWADASISACVLNKDKEVLVFRNGKRPLYLTSLANGYIVTSTEDIPKRAGLFFPTAEVPFNVYMTLRGDMSVRLNAVRVPNSKDLQHYE